MSDVQARLRRLLEDEVSATANCDRLLDAIELSDLSEPVKVLAKTIAEKIKTDELTHCKMLSMLEIALNN